jgi:predicted lipid-binding transport protein (Tim44 family)
MSAGAGQDDKVTTEGRVVITPLLIRPTPRSSQPSAPAADSTAAAAEADESAQEPAAKKPRHDECPGAAAAAAGAGSGGRGMASVHSSAGVQPAVACYVCQLATIPGKFDPQKAAQLGVQRGPVRMLQGHWAMYEWGALGAGGGGA